MVWFLQWNCHPLIVLLLLLPLLAVIFQHLLVATIHKQSYSSWLWLEGKRVIPTIFYLIVLLISSPPSSMDYPQKCFEILQMTETKKLKSVTLQREQECQCSILFKVHLSIFPGKSCIWFLIWYLIALSESTRHADFVFIRTFTISSLWSVIPTSLLPIFCHPCLPGMHLATISINYNVKKEETFQLFHLEEFFQWTPMLVSLSP